MFRVRVFVKRRTSILDPQGKAVEIGAKHLGLANVQNTRIDKLIEFDVNVNDKSVAEKDVDLYCRKLLSNPIMEDYEYTLEEVK